MLQLHLSDQHAVGAAPTGDAPTTSEWSTIILPTEVWLILEVWRYTILHSTFCNWRINFYAQCINYLKTSATSSRKQPKTLVIIVVRMLYGTVFRCFQTRLLCNESFYTNHWKFQTHVQFLKLRSMTLKISHIKFTHHFFLIKYVMNNHFPKNCIQHDIVRVVLSWHLQNFRTMVSWKFNYSEELFLSKFELQVKLLKWSNFTCYLKW